MQRPNVKQKHQTKKDIPVVKRMKVHKWNESSKKPNCFICINDINLTLLKSQVTTKSFELKHSGWLSFEERFFLDSLVYFTTVLLFLFVCGFFPSMWPYVVCVWVCVYTQTNFSLLFPSKFMKAQVVSKELSQPLKFKLRQCPTGALAPATLPSVSS